MPDRQTWLSLLLDDAPADAIEAHRLALRADGQDGERIDAEARRTLQLRAALTERRQRSAELGALLDLAGRLTGLRDVDALLQEIVTQARRLLSVDVAYLATVEDEGSLRIRVTDGSLGDRLRGTELSRREGIAGRVAETREPFRTPDYLSETAIVHSGHVDEIAAGERISAIAGVPLRTGDRVIGVLFAAERSRRDFTDGEVSLLASLASHATVAIENARLFEELLEANELLRQQHEATQRAAALHERLTGVVLSGGTADDVVRALVNVVGGRIDLVPAGGPTPDAGPAAGGYRAVVPVLAGDERLGALVAVTDAAPTAADIRLLERSASTIALVLLSERAVVDARSRSRSELVETLLDNPGDPTIEPRLRAAGVDLRNAHCVAVVEPAAGARNEARALADALAASGLAADHQGALVALVPGDDQAAVVDEARRAGGGAAVATVAVAGPATGPIEVAAAHVEARRAVRLLAALGRTGAAATVDELGPFRYLFDRAGEADALRFIERAIGPLLDHDRRRRGELVTTLEAYLDNAQQHAATAAALGIHANTLYQRLGRIAELLGDDWRTRALDLHLATRLNALRTRLGMDGGHTGNASM